MLKAGFKICYQVLSGARAPLENPERMSFIVPPWKLDLNLHMNNAAYLSIANQARLVFMAKKGILSFLIKKSYHPVIIKNEVVYSKSLGPFKRFEVVSQIASVEDNVISIEHQFESGGRRYASCTTSSKILSKDKRELNLILEEFEEIK